MVARAACARRPEGSLWTGRGLGPRAKARYQVPQVPGLISLLVLIIVYKLQYVL